MNFRRYYDADTRDQSSSEKLCTDGERSSDNSDGCKAVRRNSVGIVQSQTAIQRSYIFVGNGHMVRRKFVGKFRRNSDDFTVNRNVVENSSEYTDELPTTTTVTFFIGMSSKSRGKFPTTSIFWISSEIGRKMTNDNNTPIDTTNVTTTPLNVAATDGTVTTAGTNTTSTAAATTTTTLPVGNAADETTFRSLFGAGLYQTGSVSGTASVGINSETTTSLKKLIFFLQIRRSPVEKPVFFSEEGAAKAEKLRRNKKK
ncbi:hypothetical protein F2Q70_00035560 [Brassica cretica]|uniref:Uncharacterized protein n=1 Tax=Brassica cretica TaxID=69181 RepID=A0A8S9JTR7_BRACR|nr:hypothetical protein F2Q70_00035560 [Brassica cretica]